MEPILGQRKWIPFQRKTMVGQKENHPPPRRMIFLSHCLCDLSSKEGTTYRQRGAVVLPNFFKILNSRHIFKILENKLKKNYIYPSRKLYLLPQYQILVPSLLYQLWEYKISLIVNLGGNELMPSGLYKNSCK